MKRSNNYNMSDGNIDLDKFLNESSYKLSKEYVELQLAIEAFPDTFSQCKEKLKEKLENFMKTEHKRSSDLALQMYNFGYKEKDKAEKQISKLISLIN